MRLVQDMVVLRGEDGAAPEFGLPLADELADENKAREGGPNG